MKHEKLVSKPLAGLTVIEHGAGVAAQYCGRLLAIMGAKVIRVESPEGCNLRLQPPFLPGDVQRGALFEYLNVDKLAVTCDLRQPESRDRFNKLLVGVDLLIDDTPRLKRPALQLEPQQVMGQHRDLSFISVLPFGAKGPHSDYSATELNIFHAGGEGFLMPNGLALEMFPERPPVKLYGSFAELVGGISATCAALAAAIVKSFAGGQFVDTSVQDANVSLGSFAVQRYGDGIVETRHERSFKYGGVLPCADGYVELLVLEQHQWLALVELMGKPDWVRAEFMDPLVRSRSGKEINGHLRRWSHNQSVASIVRNGQALKVPIAPYNNSQNIYASEQIKARGCFSTVVTPEFESLPIFNAPFQFDGGPLAVSHMARPVGADDEKVWATANKAFADAIYPKAKHEVSNVDLEQKNGLQSPLSSLRILDFTLHAAGPYCTHMLALLGAQCIKIESVGRPDMFRRPHPVYGRMEPAEFDQVNAGKLSVRLNLKHPRAVELAKQLTETSDIVAENFRPGVMERLGLSYKDLIVVNPSLVMVSISAAGQIGPDAKHAGYAPLFGATGGLGMLSGYQDGPPVEIRHVMDHITGLNATAATLAAYYQRQKTGRGQHVDVSASEVATSLIGDALMLDAAGGTVSQRVGNDRLLHAPHNVYPCAEGDSWVSIAVTSESQWLAFLQVTELHELKEESKFAKAEDRWRNRELLDRTVGQWTSKYTSKDVCHRLQSAGVPSFPSYTSEDIAWDRHMIERGFIQSLKSSGAKPRQVVGAPWSFERTPADDVRPMPSMGEHSEYVFGEILGLSKATIQSLVEEHVIW